MEGTKSFHIVNVTKLICFNTTRGRRLCRVEAPNTEGYAGEFSSIYVDEHVCTHSVVHKCWWATRTRPDPCSIVFYQPPRHVETLSSQWFLCSVGRGRISLIKIKIHIFTLLLRQPWKTEAVPLQMKTKEETLQWISNFALHTLINCLAEWLISWESPESHQATCSLRPGGLLGNMCAQTFIIVAGNLIPRYKSPGGNPWRL